MIDETAKRSKREWAVRFCLLLCGLCIGQLGVAFYVLSNQGSDPFTMLLQGLSISVGLTIGTWQMLVQIVLLIVFLLTTKSYIRPGTFVCVLGAGPLTDAWLWLLRDVLTADLPLSFRVILMILGTVTMSVGVSLIIKTDAGTGTNDLIAVVITDRLKRIQFRWVRITVDATFAVLGILLGAVFGIGTIAGTFLVGPVVQLFFPLWERVVRFCVTRSRR
jgi:Predicted membrane protein